MQFRAISKIFILFAVIIAVDVDCLAEWEDDALSESYRVLISPAKGDKERVAAILLKDGDLLVARALEMIERGDAENIRRGSRLLGIVISPWFRDIERGKQHHGYIKLLSSPRHTQRATNHPDAQKISVSLVRSLSRVVVLKEAKPKPNIQFDLLSWRLGGVLCKVIAEVADESVMSDLAAILKECDDRALSGGIIAVFEAYYCLPKGYRIGGMCGNSTPDEIKRFVDADREHCEEGKKLVLSWHEKYKGQAEKSRLDAALGEWIKLLQNQNFKHRSYYGGDWAWKKLEPLIRGGAQMIPLIEAQKKATLDIGIRANLEVVRAAITGKVDATLVRDLLASKDVSYKHHEAVLALEIIVAAGNDDWIEELNDLQFRPYFKQKKASHALAICHRKMAIPLLKSAVEKNPSNYTAKYAILELESEGE